MKIQSGTDNNLYTRNQENVASAAQQEKKEAKEEMKSIDASQLNLGQDSIAQRKDQAKRKPWISLKSSFNQMGRSIRAFQTAGRKLRTIRVRPVRL